MGGRSTHEGRAGQGTARRPRRHDDMEICRRQLDEVGVRSDEGTERIWMGNGASRAAVVVGADVKHVRPARGRRHCS